MDEHKKAASGGNRRGSEGGSSRSRHSTRRRRKAVDAATQRARLLAYLVEHGSVSTLEARGGRLRIMSPAARVFELKERGIDIYTVMDERQGCGRYYLRGGAYAIDG